MKDIEIDVEFVTLGQLLKMTDAISSGGMAKWFLHENEVYVNGEELVEPYIHDVVTEGDIDTVVPENSVFVLGDNREISLDSRYDSVGFINDSDILGKVFVRLYPFNKIGLLG